MVEGAPKEYMLGDLFEFLAAMKGVRIDPIEDFEAFLETGSPLVGAVEESLGSEKVFGWMGSKEGIDLSYVGADTGKERGGPKEGMHINYQGRRILFFYHNGYGHGTVILEDKKAEEAFSEAFSPGIFGDPHDRIPSSRYYFHGKDDLFFERPKSFLKKMLE
jgi:hypothetical protein